ncbi:MAG: SLBB domain-containing protein, partial [Lachnospiraceae bacterium]|nr:SLBB domain-containing protein [Lachnospiraceae bacterium]
MQKRNRGLATALLCVILTALPGCGRDEPLYTAGVAALPETESTEEAFYASGSTAESDVAAGNAAGSSASVTSADGGISAGNSDADTLAGLAASDPAAQAEVSGIYEEVTGYVYVCGAVKEPGVYPIRGDMRVCDAIALAGGFSAEADEEWLNQASAVSDGQKLYVYTVEETSLMKEAGMTAEGLSSGGAGSDTASAYGSSSAGESVSADGSAAVGGAASADAGSGAAD